MDSQLAAAETLPRTAASLARAAREAGYDVTTTTTATGITGIMGHGWAFVATYTDSRWTVLQWRPGWPSPTRTNTRELRATLKAQTPTPLP